MHAPQSVPLPQIRLDVDGWPISHCLTRIHVWCWEHLDCIPRWHILRVLHLRVQILQQW